MKPHKHDSIIKAWADGYEVEYQTLYGEWKWVQNPAWSDETNYRIKPEPKPDVVEYRYAEITAPYSQRGISPPLNLKLTFDGETGKLKSAEVL